jgi:hypothetical protein
MSDKRKDEVFVSIDVEADGPCPIKHSMLSIGAVACDSEGYLFQNNTDFQVNLLPIPGSTPDPKTMREFWSKFPEEYKATQVNQQPPKKAMRDLITWIRNLPGRDEDKTIIVNPSVFDSSYLYIYSHMFLGEAPLGFRHLDIQSYAASTLVCPFKDAQKRAWPTWWLSGLKHSHLAIEDAYEQLDSWLRIYHCNLYGSTEQVKKMVLKRPRGSK